MSASQRGIPEQRAVNAGNAMQGMISPGTPFVDADGTLTPTNFRFLWGMFQAINALTARVTTIEQRLHNANIP